MGNDAIRVALIYKPASVTLVGQTGALNSVAFINGGDSGPRNRASLLQAFQDNGTGAVFLVNVNHLKSKGSACDAPDAGDGQGNCNVVRVNAVNELLAWFATDPTGTGDPDILMIGDYNAYAMEDPITTLLSAGFTNIVSALLGPDAYSYVFDGQWGYLDQALGSASILSQVSGVGDYHINSDEPSVLDYNDDFKSPGQIISLYAADEFRVSDHDPVVIGLDFNVPNTPPSGDAGGPYSVVEGGSVIVTASGSDPEGGSLSYAWDLDNDGSYETAGQSVTFSAAALTAPSSYTIGVQVTDEGGLTAVAITTVTVIYNFNGFFAPVLNPPAINEANAGRSIPIKFSLNGDQGLTIIVTGFPKSQAMTCDTSATITPLEPTATAGQSGLTYDPASDQYVYVWKTSKSWANTCRAFVIQFDDGTTHYLYFQFN
jgi:hypothetical protein